MPSTRTSTRREVLAAALAAGALAGDAAAQESGSGESTPTAGEDGWQSFQDGPRNVGYAPAARGPVDAGEVAWSHPVATAGMSSRPAAPAGTTSPAVDDDTVYVGSGERTVLALSRADGTRRWTFQTDGEVVSSPAVDGRRLYVGSNDHRVYALHTAKGLELWSFETGGRVRSAPAIAAVGDGEGASADGEDPTNDSATPAAGGAGPPDEKTIFVGGDDGILYALDAADGSVRWTYSIGDPVGSPAVRVPGDDASDDPEALVFVGDREGGVFALTAADGAERWTAKLNGAIRPPTVADDLVYVGDGDGRLHALSAADGSRRWQFAPDGPVASPAVAGDVLYLPASGDGLYALSAADGTELWFESMNGKLGPPAVAGMGPQDSSVGPAETVFVAQGRGDVIVRALSADDGDQRWAAELNGGSGTAPAVVGETLYVNAGEVAAIDERGRTPTPTGTPWDADVVLESWRPTFGAWLGAFVGAPAVLGTLVYALGRLRPGDDEGRTGDGGAGGFPDEPVNGYDGGGPSDDESDGDAP